MIFESSRTHKLVVRYSVIYWPYELPMSARTCAQPRSEVATVSMGCGQVPEPISGRRRCVWGSWHLQSAHPSDHCESGGARRCRQPSSSLPSRMQRPLCRVHLSTWLVSVQVMAGTHLVARDSSLSADNAENQLSTATHSRPPTCNTNRAHRRL